MEITLWNFPGGGESHSSQFCSWTVKTFNLGRYLPCNIFFCFCCFCALVIFSFLFYWLGFFDWFLSTLDFNLLPGRPWIWSLTKYLEAFLTEGHEISHSSLPFDLLYLWTFGITRSLWGLDCQDSSRRGAGGGQFFLIRMKLCTVRLLVLPLQANSLF